MNRILLTTLVFLTVSAGVVKADSLASTVTSASELSQPAKVTDSDIKYTGEKVSFNFQDTPIRQVLEIFADFSGTKMVVTDTVTGNVTLRLDNVPWDQALDMILKSKGLDKKITNNVMLIAPTEELRAREQQ